MIHNNNLIYCKKNKYKCITVIFAFFFLNRIISVEILESGWINELYVLISEVYTVAYVLLCFGAIAKKNHIYVHEVSFILIIAFYFIYFLISTLMLGGNIRRIFMTAYPIIGTICMIDYESRRNPRELFLSMVFFFDIMVVWNFIDMLLIKKVLNNYTSVFWLGGRNQLAIFLSLAFAFTLGYYEKYKKLKDIKLIYVIGIGVIIFVSLIFSRSVTSIICTFAIFVLYFLLYIKKKNILINPIVVGIVYVITWVALIVLRIHYLLADLLMKLFGRDISLSHRTIIWDTALEFIKDKPIFGYGMPDSYNVFSVHHDYTGGNNDVWTSISGHNELLQLLYCGGMVLVIILIGVYLIGTAKCRRSELLFPIFFLSVIAILIVWLSEVPGEYALFFVLGICYYSKMLERE